MAGNPESRSRFERIQAWWKTFGAGFFTAQLRRAIAGGSLGCLLAILWHLLHRDTAFLSIVTKKWNSVATAPYYEGVQSYHRELIALSVFVGLPIAWYLFSRLGRRTRAWWAGIWSAMTAVSAFALFAILTFGPVYPKRIWAACLSVLIIDLAFEHRRQRYTWRAHYRPKEIAAFVPRRSGSSATEEGWAASSTDEPITDWEQDLVGRSAIVELICEHIISGTPVVALNAGLGDGKSSVLNLVRKTMERRAIVISFSAWLPGTESTLALDLFKDIAAECRRRLYVPQLKKQALAYARTLSGSISILAGLRELLPSLSQRDEIEELRTTLQRVPYPIVVLIDEIDRMQRAELLVLLKILRGIASISNVTFVCAFSDQELRTRLRKDQELSYEYLEKFFPVSLSLAPPSPEMLGRLFKTRLTTFFEENGWFEVEAERKRFLEPLERLWTDCFSSLCGNFRKAGLLLSDIRAAATPLKREVDPVDLSGVECLRRFFPDIYHLIKTRAIFLAFEESSWTSPYLMDDEGRKRDSEAFFKDLNEKLDTLPMADAGKALLAMLFPRYEPSWKTGVRYSSFRHTTRDSALEEKRVCHPDYFPIYFRSSIPEEMFSNAELSKLVSYLNKLKSEGAVRSLFQQTLASIPKGHPKREDFLWKLGRSAERLNEEAAENLAYAAATNATEYQYDIMNLGEAARALNIVFESAQKLATKPAAQGVLEGSMERAKDDTFAARLLEYTEDRERNKVLTDFSHIDPAKVREAFMRRMRKQYGQSDSSTTANIAHGDWRAFREWVNNNDQDCVSGQQFWRSFIGESRKRFAQAINFIYPGNVSWSSDPRPIIDKFFPLQEAAQLVKTLPNTEELTEAESKGIERFEKLLTGTWGLPGFDYDA